MGGHSSSTTEYRERPLTQEERNLLKQEAEMAKKLGKVAEKSETRSEDLYKIWKQTFMPLERSMVGKVQETNASLGKVDKNLLSSFQAAALSSVGRGAKQGEDRLKQFFAQRGLSGSGLEAQAMASLQSSISQSAAQALQQGFFQALEKSDLLRQQRLQNLGQAVAVGRGFSAGGFNYQQLTGNQYGNASSAFGQTFSNWDKRWKPFSTSHRSSGLGGVFSALDSVVSITKKIP